MSRALGERVIGDSEKKATRKSKLSHTIIMGEIGTRQKVKVEQKLSKKHSEGKISASWKGGGYINGGLQTRRKIAPSPWRD